MHARRTLPPPWDGDIDTRGDAFSLHGRWLVSSDPALAVAVALKALAQARSRRDAGAQARALVRIASVARNQGDAARGRRLLMRARRISQNLNDPQLTVRLAIFEMKSWIDEGRYEDVLASAEGILPVARALDDQAALPQCLGNVAAALSELGEHELAIEAYNELNVMFNPALPDHESHRASSANNLAMAWLGVAEAAEPADPARQAALARARAYAEQAFASSLTMRERMTRINYLDTLVQVLVADGRGDEALSQVERFRLRDTQPPEPGSSAEVWLQLALLSAQVARGGQPTETLAALLALQALQHPETRRGYRHRLLLKLLAQAHENVGHHEAALRCHEQWTRACTEQQTVAARARIRRLQGTLLSLRGESIEFLAHDLCAPLAAAAAQIRLLPEPLGATVGQADAGVQRALDAAAKYLTLVRAEHMQPAELVPLDLAELADDACESAATRLRDGVRLVREIEWGPQVLGDRGLLSKALLEALYNAIEQAPPMSHVRLSLVADPKAGATLEISDSGPGLPDTMRQRLHQRFALGQDESDPGRGMGLALIARVARLHGVRIDVLSAAGQGTTLQLRFPPP
jgi:signal transduction histidine kinase